MSQPKKPVGRRPGTSDTRSAILAAARSTFAERGYDRTTIRLVASEAGVDPALLIHYFQTKQQLFLAAILPSYQAPGLLQQALADIGPENFGQRLAQLIAQTMEDQETRSILTGLIRAAASEPEAARVMRAFVEDNILQPIAEQLSGPHARLRASLLGSQIVGIFLTRYIVGLEPVAIATPEEIAVLLAPIIQVYMHEA